MKLGSKMKKFKVSKRTLVAGGGIALLAGLVASMTASTVATAKQKSATDEIDEIRVRQAKFEKQAKVSAQLLEAMSELAALEARALQTDEIVAKKAELQVKIEKLRLELAGLQ